MKGLGPGGMEAGRVLRLMSQETGSRQEEIVSTDKTLQKNLGVQN